METEQIFKHDSIPHFSYNRKKEDYVLIEPTSGSIANLNKTGEIKFEVYNQQSFLYLPESFLVCRFEIKETETADLGTDKITLEHNFFPRLFSQMRLDIGAKNLEEIQNPGEADTLIKSIMSSNDYSEKYGQLTGWMHDSENNKVGKSPGYNKRFSIYNENKKFEIRWYLNPLFGMADYHKILWGLELSLSLQRNINNEEIFWGNDAIAAVGNNTAVAATKGFLKINSLQWWIPQITPSLDVEIAVTKRLNSNKNIPVVFLKRSLISQDIKSAKYTWNIANISNNPRYLIFGFKHDSSDFHKNNSRFISYSGTKQITSLRLALNQTYYPINKMEFKPTESSIQHPYGSYIEMCKIFGNEPMYDFKTFKDFYSVFCFDTSSQHEDLKKNGIQISLEIEKSSDFNLRAYCLVLEDSEYSITVNNGQMIRID